MENILDDDTVFLASGVAIDIDNMLSQRSSGDLKAMRYLGERLNNYIRSPMDPIIIDIFDKTINKPLRKVQTVTELLGEVVKIAKTLSSGNPMENPNELRQAGDFCVALSKAIMGYRRELYSLRHQI